MTRLVRLVYAPFKWLWGLVAPQSEPAKKAPEKKSDAMPSLLRIGTQMQSMRDSLRTMGVPSLRLQASSLQGSVMHEFTEAFPFPPYGGHFHAIRALIVGAVLALLGAAWFSGRFFAAQRRIPMQSKEVAGVGGFTKAEESMRHEMFTDAARAEQASSLEVPRVSRQSSGSDRTATPRGSFARFNRKGGRQTRDCGSSHLS